MAKQKVVPGGDLDILTHDEAAALIQAQFKQTVLERIHAQQGAKTDAAGGVTVAAFQVPMGMEFRLTRVVVEADGFTYAVMFTNAAGSVVISRGGQLVDGCNLAAGLPNTWSAGSGSAPRYRNGEKVEVIVVGGPVATNISVRVEGDQYPDHAPSAS